MKDERGLYYHPTLQTRSVRMYVRENAGQVEFRMWNAEEAEIWDQHGWVPHQAIAQAAALYRESGSDRNPLALYDLNVAKRLIQDGE